MAGTKSQRRRGISWSVILFLLALIVGVLWWRGHSFYLLGLSDRVEHDDYRQLRSSGLIGYGYGVVGTFLIFANLLYLARRRFARWRLGSMRTWLDIHVFTGLTGAAFIAFHSTFKARTSISKATVASLVVVIITGLAGRFLYALVPRRNKEDLTNAIDAFAGPLPGVTKEIQTILDEYPVPPAKSGSLLAAIRHLPMSRAVASNRLEAVDLVLDNAMHAAGPRLPSPMKEERRRLEREIVRASRVVWSAAMLRSWRSLHRFFAILMLLTVVFHIGVAWYYGYRWFWSE